VLFGAFFAYAVVDLFSVVQRHAVKSFEPAVRHDVLAVIAGIVIALVFMTFHRILFGVRVVPFGI
jgi:putative Ca2+/H+ antiporter (TMEM165/GDT1 family)